MKNFLRLYYSDGQGDVTYQEPSGIPPGATAITSAADGVSVRSATPNIVRLGQDVGQAGDPAILTEDREIPNPGDHTVYFGRNNGIDDVVGINSGAGISIDNASGQGILIFCFGINWNFAILSATDIQETLGTENWHYDDTTKRITFSDTIVAGGGLGAKTAHSSSAVINVAKDDYTILIDSSGGNIVVNMDPAILGNQIFNFKKTSSDVNTITLTPVSGTIQDIGAPAASLVFNMQGESICVQCDGTNFYVI